jgi:hypothetical protein
MANIELDGANKKIKVDSGDLTLDVPGDIILDADGADLVFADGGTNILKVTNSSSDVVFQPQVDAKDLKFNQYDGRTLLEVNDGGFVAIANGATGPGQLRIYEDTDNGTNYTALQVGAQSGDITYTLPTADGSDGQFLKTDGSGNLAFATVSTSTAFDDVTAGDAAVSVTTSSGNITVDAQGNDTDIIFKGTDNTSDTTFLTLDGSEGGQLVLGAHGQINFPDSANVSTDANVLDDYQEGDLNLSSSQLSNFFTGKYTKIGRMVWFTCAGVVPSSGNSATQTLSGLPFTVKDADAELGGDAGGSDNAVGIVAHHSDSGAIAVKFVLDNNATTCKLYQSDNSVATHATFSGDTFNLAGFYTTDA